MDILTQHILENNKKQLDEGFIIIPVIPGMEKVMIPLTAGVITATVLLWAMGSISIKAKKKKFPECNKYKTTMSEDSEIGHFHLCVSKAKINLAKKELIALNRLKSQCNKTKDQSKCQSKVKDKMMKVKDRIVKLNNKIKNQEKWAKKEK